MRGTLTTLTVVLLLTGPVLAVSGTTVAHLPAAVTGATASVVGTQAFVIGGRLVDGNYSSSIVAFSQGAGAMTVGQLPRPTGATRDGVQSAASASVDGVVYIFGGAATTEATFNGEVTQVPASVADIVSFDPSSGSSRLTLDRLPAGAWGIAAVASGTDIFLFGGFTFDVANPSAIQRHDWVLRYDTSAAEGSRLTTLSTRLPYGLQDAGAAKVDDAIFVLGGLHDNSTADACPYQTSNGTYYLRACSGNGIVRFDIATQTMDGIVARLPEAVQWPSAATVGGLVHSVGGRLANGDPTGTVVTLDPATFDVRTLPGCLPEALYAAPLVNLEGALFRFGGRGPRPADLSDDITRIDPDGSGASSPPGVPTRLDATRDGSGVRLSWSPPACGSGSVTSYLIARAVSPDGEFATVGTSTTTSFVDASADSHTAFSYRVASVNDNGTSAYSAVVFVPTLPSAPRALTATPIASLPRMTTRLDWEAPADTGGVPIEHYEVLRAVGNGPETVVGTTWDTTFVDATAPLARHATYRVVAFNSVGGGDASDPVTLTLRDRVHDAVMGS